MTAGRIYAGLVAIGSILEASGIGFSERDMRQGIYRNRLTHRAGR
jgi:hypothetical protein